MHSLVSTVGLWRKDAEVNVQMFQVSERKSM
jgi:hypothetical protein